MKYLKSSLFVITLLFSQLTMSQPIEEWVARFTQPPPWGEGLDRAECLAMDLSGNVYVTGGITDYATIKYSSERTDPVDVLWVAIYDGHGYNDGATDMKIDIDGNVYVTGWSDNNGPGYATIKYDTKGNEIWVSRYDGLYYDGALALALDSRDNVYVTGYSSGLWEHDIDIVTIKYDTNGNQQWLTRYNSPDSDDDCAYDMVIDNTDHIYITGYSRNFGYTTIKYDGGGNQRWISYYRGPGDILDIAYAMVLDSQSNVYITGKSYSINRTTDYATVKYDRNGNELWSARYNGPGNNHDDAFDIALDSSGNVYVTGSSFGLDEVADYATVKYDSNGVMQWAARYDGPGSYPDKARAITVSSAGYIYVTGQSCNNSEDVSDYTTVKYDSDGNELWVVRYESLGDGYHNRANDIIVDNSGFIYVTGASRGEETSEDYATIKYRDESTGIIEADPSISSVYALLSNYPNPFNDATTIKYGLPESGKISIDVYNILGRKVETLVDEHQDAGYYSINWDASTYSSGIYFYKLTTNNKTLTKRMTLLK
ncbi:MAG: T9SS type A sorting domain-containing protein [candidate division Zixibacteria bacterium]|nr:T9SS type A sorting domain-containing protein [candidate division Zixibacteria bacterium]